MEERQEKLLRHLVETHIKNRGSVRSAFWLKIIFLN
jgi:hypothetical protein